MVEIDDWSAQEMWFVLQMDAQKYVLAGAVKCVSDSDFTETIPIRMYKSFDHIPDAYREDLKTALTFCKINREQKEKVAFPNLVPEQEKVYKDTQSVSFRWGSGWGIVVPRTC
jgi:hypothetical protein